VKFYHLPPPPDSCRSRGSHRWPDWFPCWKRFGKPWPTGKEFP